MPILVRSSLLVLVGLAAVLTVRLFNSPGTDDVAMELNWVANADRHGIVEGFAASDDTYPPIIPVMLSVAARIGQLAGASAFTAFKASLLVCLLLTSLVTYLWTRHALLAVIMYIAWLPNSLALGYLDVCVAPVFVGALWALSVGRLPLSAVLFTLACLTKFQPLIIAPILAVYVFRQVMASGRRSIRTVWSLLLPSGLILVAFVMLFGRPLLRALKVGMLQPQLSAGAFNLQWIVTYGLHVLAPDTHGALIDGRAELIVPQDALLMNAARAVFAGVYLLVLVLFMRRPLSFRNLVFFSLTAYMTYFTLSPGVHENHLFLAAILGLVLYWLDRAYWLIALALVVMTNLNSFVFYGIDGRAMGFNPVMAGLDLTVVFSAVTVTMFGVLLRRCVPSEGPR